MIIKDYEAKTGRVTIEEIEGEYRVRHSILWYLTQWYKDRTEAIKAAQFLTRY